MSEALAKGYQFGFESSSDHRSTHISYANVCVTDTTRQGILEGLSKRRVYASNDLILADVRIGEHFMGEAFTMTGAPVVSVNLQGTGAFAEVVIVKDGKIVYCPVSGPKSFCFTWRDNNAQAGQQSYYYVRGVQEKTPGQSATGAVVWTGPTWVTLQ